MTKLDYPRQSSIKGITLVSLVDLEDVRNGKLWQGDNNFEGLDVQIFGLLARWFGSK